MAPHVNRLSSCDQPLSRAHPSLHSEPSALSLLWAIRSVNISCLIGRVRLRCAATRQVGESFCHTVAGVRTVTEKIRACCLQGWHALFTYSSSKSLDNCQQKAQPKVTVLIQQS